MSPLWEFVTGQKYRTNAFLLPITDFVSEYKQENEFACLLEEYRSLRAEVVFRLGAQTSVSNWSIVLLAGSLPVASAFVDRGQYSFLLLIPIVFVLMGWIMLDQENMIDAIVAYINVNLAPRIEALLGDKLSTSRPMWEWELFQYNTFYRSDVTRAFHALLGFVRYVLPILPGVASVTAFWLLANSIGFAVTTVDIVVTAVDILAMLLLAFATVLLKQQRLNVLKMRGANP